MGLSLGAFSDLGGAVSSIFGGIGDLAEASAYEKAATYAQQNAQIEKESTAVKEFMAARQITQTMGSTQAVASGGGFTLGGSTGDILHDSARQGALTKNLIELQGAINVNGYLEQAASYQGMASAAKAAGAGGIFGGILKGIGAVASIAGFI